MQSKHCLPAELVNPMQEHMHLVEVRDVENEVDPGGPSAQTAESIETGTGESAKVWMSKDLLSVQLRQLAENLGCVRMKLGLSSKFIIQKAVEQKRDHGTACDRFDTPNPIADENQLRVNTTFWIVNIAFLPEFFD